MRSLRFTAESSLYRPGRSIRSAQILVPQRLCRDGTLVPCAPAPCDAGVCWDCAHVCPEDPPAYARA
jgi:hypothetical protein